VYERKPEPDGYGRKACRRSLVGGAEDDQQENMVMTTSVTSTASNE
jgi:hypothetical protein